MSEQMVYSYDVFVSYNPAPADRKWTENWLIPRLRKAGLNICTRDMFAPGAPELVNIEKAITASRHTLLVLTPAWVESDWESFAGLLARSDDPVGHRRRTIPLLLQTCTPPRSIARLVYADFADSDAWPPQFERLIAVLKGHLHRTAFGPPLGALLGLESPTNFIFRRNEHFIGREEELAALHDLLDETTPLGVSSALHNLHRAPKVAGLTGLGGIGKTQLAVEYIHRYSNAYPGGIFWANAAESLAEEFAKIGMLICGNGHDKSQAELVKITADYLHSDPDTLVVLDNLTEPDWLNVPVENVLVPAALPCRVLFTTRRRDLPGLRTMDVNTLPMEQALHLLLRYPDRRAVLDLDPMHPEQQTARRICAALGCLPLALELAAAYLDQVVGDVSLAGYLARLGRYGAVTTVDAEQDEKTAWQRSPTWHDPVSVTLASQWDALRGENTRLLLQAAALMPEAEAVPAARLGLLAGLDNVAEPGFRSPLSQALQGLHGYSVLEILEGGQVRLHPLVREFAERKIPGRAAFAAACSKRLAKALWDVARLNQQVIRRGVDAVLEDVRIGLGFCANKPKSQPYPRLSSLERVLDRQAHHLRGWDTETLPSFFLQQLRNESLERDYSELRVHAEAELARLDRPYLRERFKGSRESPELVRTLQGHSSSVHSVAVSADGRLVVSVSSSGWWNNTFIVWDVATGRELRTLTARRHREHRSPVNDVALSADGHLAVSVSDDKTVRVWDVIVGHKLRTLMGHRASVNGVALTADGQLAITASKDHKLKVWEVATGRQLRSLKGHHASVNGVAVSADGRLAVSASEDKTLKVWDVATFRELRTLRGHGASVNDVVVSADGRLAVSASEDKTLKVWDVATGQELYTLKGHSSVVNSVALSGDGKLAVSASDDKTVKVWKMATGCELRTLIGHSGSVKAVALSANGQLAVSASDDQTVKVWDISAETALSTGEVFNGDVAMALEPRALQGHSNFVKGLALSADGQLAVSTSYDQTLKVLDVATGKELRTLIGHEDWVTSVTLSADGRLAISASDDRTLKVWDVTTGRELRTLRGHGNKVCNVALSADGRLAVSASYDKTLKVWDVATGKELHTLIGHEDWVTSVTLSADGRLIVSASGDKTLKVWDAATGCQLCTLTGHSSEVTDLALSADGQLAVSASGGRGNPKELKVWDVATGLELRTLKKHSDEIHGVALSADGRLAVSVSEDKTLKVWDVATGQIISMLPASAPLDCCAISADGKTIVAGDSLRGMHFLALESGNDIWAR